MVLINLNAILPEKIGLASKSYFKIWELCMHPESELWSLSYSINFQKMQISATDQHFS